MTKETVLSDPFLGGCPRPSFRWHRWQERALKIGPSPSEASVDEGDETQSLRNNALPNLKSNSDLNDKLAEFWENAFVFLRIRAVVSPAELFSNFSACEKLVVGNVIFEIRINSSFVRGIISDLGSGRVSETALIL
mgnify:CR=1 FL=1